ncbi:MAG: diguanylate cyclase [Polyangiaceae bacterium]
MKESGIRAEGLEPEQLLHEVVAAGRAHRGWVLRWHRHVLCRLPADAAYSGPAGHLLCRFGLWHAEALAQAVASSQEVSVPLVSMGQLHKAVHEEGRCLAAAVEAGRAIQAWEYDGFARTSETFTRAVLDFERTLRSRLADRDPLTDVANRRSMERRLEDELDRLREGGGSACLVMIDIDHFKTLNDTLGHPAGDEVLRRLTRQIRRQIRPSDHLFRYGGDEFLLCLQDVTPDNAVPVLERILHEARGLGQDLGIASVTLSMGMCDMDPGGTVEEAIQRADQALYAAKGEGRDRIRILASATSNSSSANHEL